MPDPKTKNRLKGLKLSAADLREITKWSGSLIEDYLSNRDNLNLISDELDDEIDKLLEETPTEFLDGTVPFVNDGFLAEDNDNFFWDIINELLKLKALILNDTTASRLLATDADKKAVSVADLTAWIIETFNQVLATDLGNGKVQLSLPQNIDTDADVEFDSAILDDLTALQVVSADALKKLISTGVTTVDLVSLTDDSMVDLLHRHSELSASDGDPDSILSIDVDGNVAIGIAPGAKNFEVFNSINCDVRFKAGRACTVDIDGGISWDKKIRFLHSGSLRWQMFVDANVDQDFVIRSNTGHEYYFDRSTGNFGVGTLPTEKVEIVGNLFLQTDSDKILLGAGKDTSIYFDGEDLIINSENITANDELHFTNFDKYTFDNDVEITGDSTVSGVRNQKYYCEAYIDASRTITIVTADVWHPAFDLSEGECSDFIRDAGGIATITAIAQNGSDITITTAAPHGFDVNDPVSFVGGTGYDTQFMITAVADTTHFDVTAAFIGTGTGFAIVGDNIETPVDGIYDFSGWFSGNGLTGASTFEFTAVIDDVVANKGKPSRKFSNTTDRGNMSGGFYLNLTAGQKLSFVARNIGGTNDFTSSGTNIRIGRI